MYKVNKLRESEPLAILLTHKEAVDLAWQIDDCTMFEDLKHGEICIYDGVSIFSDEDAYKKFLEYIPLMSK